MSENTEEFRNVTPVELETALKGRSSVDLFVFLASTGKHLLFVPAGEDISPVKLDNLKALGPQHLYARRRSPTDLLPEAAKALTAIPLELDAKTAFDGENLGEAAGTKLKEAYKVLLTERGTDAAPVTALITGMADKLLSTLAPEIGDLRSAVLKNIRNIRFMNHSAAITSITVLCAVANDFRSKSALQNLCHAVLLMDASLAELEDHYLDTYYRNRRELPAHILEKIMAHPVKSQQMIAYLPFATESMSQLILLHHELHNGKGYHRGIRSSTVMPMARVLALAVDLYEHIKSSELRGEPRTLRDEILGLQELHEEPHNRRHSTKLIQNVMSYLGL
jgi:hypothetical protein